MSVPNVIRALSLASLCLSGVVHAACSTPTGVAGQFLYYSPNLTYQVCDGFVWTSMASGAATATSCSVAGQISYGTAPRFCNGSFYVPMAGTDTGATCSTTAGTFQYNPTLAYMQYCNGTNLKSMRTATASASYVQQATLNYSSTNATSFTTGTFGGSGNVSTGNLLICGVWYYGTTNTISSATITGGQTMTRVLGPTTLAGSTSNFRNDVWVREGVGGSTSTKITFVTSVATSEFYALCNEYTGMQASNPVDQANVTTSGPTTITSSSLTNTTAKALLFGAATWDATDPTAGSGYTIRGAAMANCMVMDKTVIGTGAQTASVGGGSGSTSGTLNFVILRSK